MAETHRTESIAYDCLVTYLEERGRLVEVSDQKRYDLKVDGHYCELKAKRYPVDRFDFIYVSSNQYDGINSSELHTLFLVCNTDQPDAIQIFEIPGAELKGIKPKSEVKYYYDRGMFANLFEQWRVN